MRPFTAHTGVAAALPRAHVDTDQIVPKQFLKRTGRDGFGAVLFHDWRFRGDGTPDPAFELNRPEAAGASVLVAGTNFGCGSSREHAAWALADYGFRAVVAPTFADIFASNAPRNGVVPAAVAPEAAERLLRVVGAGRTEVTVDLVALEVRGPRGFRAPFTIDAYARAMLLEGLDEIGLTLRHDAAIAAYEAREAAAG